MPAKNDNVLVSADPRVFQGFPSATLLEAGELPISQLAHIALRESHRTSPLFQVHRWFARRLSSQFRAILTALTLNSTEKDRFWERYFDVIPLDGAVVLDPFVGGGTSVIEASRCNASVIGYDVDPVATQVTRFELSAAQYKVEFRQSTVDACNRVSEYIKPLHKTVVGNETQDVLHHFWVEVTNCRTCGTDFELHSHHQLAHDKKKKIQWAFCRNCYEVQELPFDAETLICRCGTSTIIRVGPLCRGKIICPSCKKVDSLAARGYSTGEPPRWKLFAQEYINFSNGKSRNGKYIREFKAAGENDIALYAAASEVLHQLTNDKGLWTPERSIPNTNRMDRRPLIHGFKSYRQLFNDRQLLHLTLLGNEIISLPKDEDRAKLSIAFSEHLTTNCMYTSYAYGYRKVSQLFSMHSYRHITRPVELNPWLNGLGRGTFPNTIRKVTSAIQFAKSPSDIDPAGGRREAARPVGPLDGIVSTQAHQVAFGKSKAAIVTASSADLSDLPNASVDLVLTDPPYFDNVSYSELSDFYLYWQQAIGMVDSPYDDIRRSAPISENLAVTSNSTQAWEQYSQTLSTVFRECARVLKPTGVCVFSYHHRSKRAWLAVGEALTGSPLMCSAVIPLRGEGRGGLTSHTGTIKWDAVFICRPTEITGDASLPITVETSRIEQIRQDILSLDMELTIDKEIGFLAPDRTNLLCASLVGAARRHVIDRTHLALNESLTSM